MALAVAYCTVFYKLLQLTENNGVLRWIITNEMRTAHAHTLETVSSHHTTALHFTASEVSADDITAPISPHRTSPLAKFTAFALHRRQITPPCKSPP